MRTPSTLLSPSTGLFWDKTEKCPSLFEDNSHGDRRRKKRIPAASELKALAGRILPLGPSKRSLRTGLHFLRHLQFYFFSLSLPSSNGGGYRSNGSFSSSS
ncbi:hypothetical protein CEXT_53291 [Caerostris extrusa]|uniref:Uncharacterized protein n=1 Tax=Caerostris extrusa TaxID=172846 RepID=A0AAV4XC86_CAEEX|nr:hypothetical protein CEXT_53291 [Caerostris extrusa]